MRHDDNVIGQNVAKFRFKRGWTQASGGETAIARVLHAPRHLANIETPTVHCEEQQVEYFAEVFGVKEGSLFPENDASAAGGGFWI